MNIVYKSPIGDLFLEFENDLLVKLVFSEITNNIKCLNTKEETVAECVKQLDEYFNKTRKTFDIKINLKGTDFQKKTWNALLTIPYGKSASYKDIAVLTGSPKAFRAVGGANHCNPVSIIVPCHRVIGVSGKLVGYGGELWRKQWLLEHES